jgi:hypothetical protein
VCTQQRNWIGKSTGANMKFALEGRKLPAKLATLEVFTTRHAAEAKVRTVVLSHLLPGANPGRGGELGDTAYIEGVRKHFTGEVIVGRDQMKL